MYSAVLSGQPGERVNMLWEKEIARCSVSLHLPRPYRWQGAGGRKWPARHGSLGCQEMAIITGTPWLSAPLSPLCKVPLYVLRDISRACVARLQVCGKGGKDRSPGRFSNSLFIREVLNAEINTG